MGLKPSRPETAIRGRQRATQKKKHTHESSFTDRELAPRCSAGISWVGETGEIREQDLIEAHSSSRSSILSDIPCNLHPSHAQNNNAHAMPTYRLCCCGRCRSQRLPGQEIAQAGEIAETVVQHVHGIPPALRHPRDPFSLHGCGLSKPARGESQPNAAKAEDALASQLLRASARHLGKTLAAAQALTGDDAISCTSRSLPCAASLHIWRVGIRKGFPHHALQILVFLCRARNGVKREIENVLCTSAPCLFSPARAHVFALPIVEWPHVHSSMSFLCSGDVDRKPRT